MKSSILLVVALLAQAAATAAHAENIHEFRIGPRIGPGELRIDAREPVSQVVVGETTEENTVGLGGTLEYRAPFGLVIEVGHFTAGESDWWEDDKLYMTEAFASVGWQLDLGRGFSLIPRVGRSRWKLEADDSWFDDDDVNPKVRGYEHYWEISAMKRLNSVVTLGVSHRENSFEFGRARSTVFTAMFNL